MGKISLFGVVKAYINTLRSYKTNKIMPSDIVVQIALPAFAAAAFAVFWPIGQHELNDISTNIISGVSIISALLCGVAVMVFQLRMQMSTQDNLRQTRKVKRLVDDTFNDILWAVVSGFTSVILTIATNAFVNFDFFQRILGGFAAFFLGNFVLVTCMCIKRLGATYREFSID